MKNSLRIALRTAPTALTLVMVSVLASNCGEKEALDKEPKNTKSTVMKHLSLTVKRPMSTVSMTISPRRLKVTITKKLATKSMVKTNMASMQKVSKVNIKKVDTASMKKLSSLLPNSKKMPELSLPKRGPSKYGLRCHSLG